MSKNNGWKYFASGWKSKKGNDSVSFRANGNKDKWVLIAQSVDNPDDQYELSNFAMFANDKGDNEARPDYKLAFKIENE